MAIEKIQKLVIRPEATLLDAMKQMDKIKVKMLFIFQKERFHSIVTIGDIQRAIIAGSKLTESIADIPAGPKTYAYPGEDIEITKDKMLRLRTDYMPVVNRDGELIDVILRKDLFHTDSKAPRGKIDLPVVVMAGGLGTRLRPITNVLPKPLIPVGNKTILESIINQFIQVGCSKFYISVNYKYDMIKYYLDQLPEHYDVTYIKEDEPLGTIGSVSLLKGKINTPFFVTNCDIMINQDFRDVYEYHQRNQNDITLVTALKTYSIPYGVIETTDGGLLTGIQEKPEMAYQINTGVYILNAEMIDEIPDNQFFHITQLMEKVRQNGGKVGCFPISDGSWTDIGEWGQYLKLIDVR